MIIRYLDPRGWGGASCYAGLGFTWGLEMSSGRFRFLDAPFR